MKKQYNISSILYRLIILLMAVWSTISFFRIITNTIDKDGGNDFHNLWYSGHFILQGTDPLYATFNKVDVNLPLKYLDGKSVLALPVAQAGLSKVPVNTAPLQLITSLFSFFSWPVAKILWMVVNLVCILVIPWLVIQLLPEQQTLGKFRVLIYLSFWTLVATRNGAGLGNPALFVFTGMLLSVILYKKHWLLAGIALGIALSKYSLSIPILIFFLYKKNFKVIAVTLLTQIISLLVLAWITWTNPFTILSEYVQIFLWVAGHGQGGIQLSVYLSNQLETVFLVAAAFSIGVLGIMIWWVKNGNRFRVIQENPLVDLLVLVILTSWGLLVLYHREYDCIVLIIFWGVLITLLRRNQLVNNPNLKKAVLITLVFSVAWLSRPGSILDLFFPGIYSTTVVIATKFITTLILSLDLGMAFVLLGYTLPSFRVRRQQAPEL